jgi:sarcosine oxidase subunit gamma
MPDLAFRSALADASDAPNAVPTAARWETPALRLEEARDLGVAVVRTHRTRATAAAAVIKVAIDLDMPLFANTTIQEGPLRSLWLAPGAWMILGERDRVGAAVASISQGVSEPYVLATDLSSGRTAIRIAGPGARALLESGCPLDLHPLAFGPGRCAASLFNEIDIVIDQIDEEPTYFLISDRASARALWDQLLDGADLAP